jgi:hypothetical protein
MLRSRNLILMGVVLAVLLFSVQRTVSRKSVNPALSPARVPAQGHPPNVAPQRSPLHPSANGVDWGKDFEASGDHFQFVSKAARSALEGDGRAAFYVAKALRTCMVNTHLYQNSPDPESAFHTTWAEQPNAPSWLVDRARKTFQSCEGFLKGDPFLDLPNRPGGYNSTSYWMELAYSDGDPLALASHAGSALAKGALVMTPDRSAASIQDAQLDINEAAMSGDPEALFQIGQIVSNGHGADSIQGFAVSLAACELGYDCSTKNSDGPFAGCIAAATCAPGLSYADIVTKSVGPDGYATAYAQAQQLEDSIARGDMDTVLKFVKLKP